MRFQDEQPSTWSRHSSEVHDPGPSWSSAGRQARFSESPWDQRGTSHLRFQDDVGGFSEGRSGSFKFQDKDVSSETTPNSPFRFSSSERSPAGFSVEGRSNSDENTGFQSNESNEFFGRNSDSNFFSDQPKKDSSEDFPWKSSEENVYSGGASKPKHSGRQSKVSPVFDYKPSSSPVASDSFEFPSSEDSDESPRHLSPDTIATISETLGAINTVGRYLVNYTRGNNHRPPPRPNLYGDRLDDPPVSLYLYITASLFGLCC